MTQISGDFIRRRMILELLESQLETAMVSAINFEAMRSNQVTQI